ncbi:hypothetical protein ACQPZ8_01615 [Actinomadura nitritigenes]|uniref:hypothetical protein n=1 Tax=Actinomadura nitritigenes TaxID=134602 RepID=UPI003D8B6662
MGETINPADGEAAAVEIAAQIVENLRAGGHYQLRYDDDQQRRVLRHAGADPVACRTTSGTGIPSRRPLQSCPGRPLAIFTLRRTQTRPG